MKRLMGREPVEHEDLISASGWGNDALLFRVNKGTGKLCMKYGSDRSGDTYGFLLLDHKPLINSYGELYCPTCARVLSLGLGRENVNQGLVHAIQYAQEEPDLGITDAFNNIKPMLSILENGYYLLTRIEMIPTDGDGQFFWNLTAEKKLYKATSDVYYKRHYSGGTPKFILPSQSVNGMNEQRVHDYIEQIKNGKTMTGLALYYRGFMSTLLDGHHRATAAYIENKTIDCLTIMKVTEYGFNKAKKLDKIYAGGEIVDLSLFRKPNRINRYLKRTRKKNKIGLTVDEVEQILEDCSNAWNQKGNSPEYDFGKKEYPDYQAMAISNQAGDISDERIREVMARRDDEAMFELEMIHKKLQLIDSNKAIDLSKQIIKDRNWRVLMEDVFRYLASLDNTEVEDIFIAYLIDTDYDAKDICRKIADKYLNKR